MITPVVYSNVLLVKNYEKGEGHLRGPTLRESLANLVNPSEKDLKNVYCSFVSMFE